MKNVSILQLSLGIVLLLSLAGCVSSDVLSADSAGENPNASDLNHDRLDGSSWDLYSYRQSRLIEGTSFSITFEAGQVQGNAGCNSFFGSYSVDQNRIVFSALGMTEMACLEPEGLMDQEQALLAFLGDSKTFELSDGRLKFFRADGEALILESLR